MTLLIWIYMKISPSGIFKLAKSPEIYTWKSLTVASKKSILIWNEFLEIVIFSLTRAHVVLHRLFYASLLSRENILSSWFEARADWSNHLMKSDVYCEFPLFYSRETSIQKIINVSSFDESFHVDLTAVLP